MLLYLVTLSVVVPAEGVKSSNLHPATTQLLTGVSEKSTDICSDLKAIGGNRLRWSRHLRDICSNLKNSQHASVWAWASAQRARVMTSVSTHNVHMNNPVVWIIPCCVTTYSHLLLLFFVFWSELQMLTHHWLNDDWLIICHNPKRIVIIVWQHQILCNTLYTIIYYNILCLLFFYKTGLIKKIKY